MSDLQHIIETLKREFLEADDVNRPQRFQQLLGLLAEASKACNENWIYGGVGFLLGAGTMTGVVWTNREKIANVWAALRQIFKLLSTIGHSVRQNTQQQVNNP